MQVRVCYPTAYIYGHYRHLVLISTSFSTLLSEVLCRRRVFNSPFGVLIFVLYFFVNSCGLTDTLFVCFSFEFDAIWFQIVVSVCFRFTREASAHNPRNCGWCQQQCSIIIIMKSSTVKFNERIRYDCNSCNPL